MSKKKFNSKRIDCEICGSKKQRFLYKIKKMGQPFKVVRCKCGLVFVNPQPDKDFFDVFYNEEYHTGDRCYRPMDMKEFKRNKEPFQRNVKMFLSKTKKKKKGSYLDVGCATGHFVQVFKDKGWDATGIDVSEYSTRFAREERGLNVLTGDVAKANLPKNHYDLITLLNVVEHLPNPREVLKELGRVLKKNGVLVITTPNAGSAVAKIRKDKWWGYDDEGHIHFFSLRTLDQLLDELGMEIFAIDLVYSYGYSLGDVLKRQENKGKKTIRAAEYLVTTRVAPVTFKCCRGLTDLLVPVTASFIKKKS